MRKTSERERRKKERRANLLVIVERLSVDLLDENARRVDGLLLSEIGVLLVPGKRLDLLGRGSSNNLDGDAEREIERRTRSQRVVCRRDES